jgi:hypothetical protein
MTERIFASLISHSVHTMWLTIHESLQSCHYCLSVTSWFHLSLDISCITCAARSESLLPTALHERAMPSTTICKRADAVATCICVVLIPVAFSTNCLHTAGAWCIPPTHCLSVLTWWLSLGGSNGWPAALSFVCPGIASSAAATFSVLSGTTSMRDKGAGVSVPRQGSMPAGDR